MPPWSVAAELVAQWPGERRVVCCSPAGLGEGTNKQSTPTPPSALRRHTRRHLDRREQPDARGGCRTCARSSRAVATPALRALRQAGGRFPGLIVVDGAALTAVMAQGDMMALPRPGVRSNWSYAQVDGMRVSWAAAGLRVAVPCRYRWGDRPRSGVGGVLQAPWPPRTSGLRFPGHRSGQRRSW